MKAHQPTQSSRFVIITLLLLFLTGQVLTVAHAQVMSDSQPTQSDSQDCHTMQDHGTLHSVAESTDMTDIFDCCQSVCQCPQAVCSGVMSLPAIGQSILFTVHTSISDVFFKDGFYLNKDQSPLYRPPII